MKNFIGSAKGVLVGTLFFIFSGQAAAQGPPGPAVVNGSGTPKTVPLWTGSGKTLSDSHVHDDGTTVSVSLPIWASNGVTGSTDSTSGQAGVAGFGDQYGVFGSASPTEPIVSPATAIGVVGNCVRLSSVGCIGIYGYGNAASGFAHGIVGETDFGPDGAGVIGITHSTGQGVRGGTNNANGIGVVGYNSAGGKAGQFQGNVLVTLDLTVEGNAYKPGGGSWSTLSDRRAKKSIEPIRSALSQFLKLHGVTYEYSDSLAFGELPGTHLGMVAQDVEEVFPSWVDTGTDGYKRLTFRGFEAVAVEAVRELDANSKEAMARIADLERQNAELRQAIALLAETVRSLQRK